mmetsp:Transcript_103413/g.200379  ORF Transcript_103413/g.200379 Transcript_103413/m.200379 type:complete len:100 (+) Transcript_103413:34-333(+)
MLPKISRQGKAMCTESKSSVRPSAGNSAATAPSIGQCCTPLLTKPKDLLSLQLEAEKQAGKQRGQAGNGSGGSSSNSSSSSSVWFLGSFGLQVSRLYFL